MVAWTLVFHIFGIVLWFSGLLMTTALLARHARETSPDARSALTGLEKKSMRMMADPGALIVIVAGITLIFSNPSYYLHAGWLHIKLTLVVILIVLHALIGTEMKSLKRGDTSLSPRKAWMLFGGVLLVLFSILVATLPGEVFMSR